MNEKVTFTVDGKQLEGKQGQLLIEACEDSGIHIPRFCWHKRLDPVGMCRMCLVEIDTPRGKTLVPSCTTQVSEELSVETESDTVKKAQEGVLEFLLINHPLDCPICDKAGECPLQDQTMAYGPGESRFIEEKRHFEKPIPISDIVLLDRERCILCARCTRFSDEISGDPLIEFIQRGNKTQVNTFPDEPFKSYFSGNTVQICPVGALTATSYRFKARPWDLKKVSSTCNCCSLGCSVELNVSQNKMLRILGEDNEFTNQGWLSDKGRYNFEYLHSENRLLNIQSRENEDFQTINISDAIEKIKNKIKDLDNPDIKFIVGANSTNEEYFAINKFANSLNRNEFLSKDKSNVYFADDHIYNGYFSDEYTNATFEDLDTSDAIVVWAEDIKDNLPVLFLRIKKAVKNGVKLVVFGHTNTALESLADHYFGAEIVSNNFELKTSLSNIQELKDIIDSKKVTTIVGKSTPLQKKDSLDTLINHLQKVSDLKIFNCFSRANTFGAIQHIDQIKGLNDFCTEYEDSNKNIVFTIGANPVNSSFFGSKIKDILEDTEYVVSLDIFKNETTELADLILPTTAFGEKEGTITNMEMRVMKQNKILPDPGSTLSEWEYLIMIAQSLGKDINYDSVNQLNSELANQFTMTEALPTFDNLNKPSNLFGILNQKEINLNIKDVDQDSPSLLMVKRLYGDSSTQINSPSISMLGSERFIELSESTLDKYGIKSNVATLTQGSSSIFVNIKLNNLLPDNLVLAPINRRGFEKLDSTKDFDLKETKNMKDLSVN
ncbi:MAG: NADH-quinone oxidoreductase subunit NuoG [Actinobacteria bacterium]|nr:NADH-quinone oxidoreductase subunit NuoG [Actinomycetota bacterium]MBT7013477.1 NADH-quinone oxidoreductase subunit NuoG [Actinomycetota bacterium]